MPIRCIAIDDEPLSIDIIRQFIAKFPSFQLVTGFTDAISAAEYLRTGPVDLIFLDINMPGVNGLDLVRSLKVRPKIIFITAYRKFAFEGFELDAVDYLAKPVSFERFEQALKKVLRDTAATPPPTDEPALFVRSDYQLVRIPFDDIEYIESLEDYLRIHRTGGKPVMTLMTMKQLVDKLPADRFRRIHRSYVVQLSKVTSVVNRKMRLTEVELPIGYTYLPVVQDWINRSIR